MKVSFSLVILALLLLLNTIEVSSVDDEADYWHHADDHELSEIWSDVSEINGENADYENDYKEYNNMQESEPGQEDTPPADYPGTDIGEAADFQSNYGEIVNHDFDAAAPFQQSADDQSLGNPDQEDQIVGGEHDIEGNVQWTTP